MLKPTIAIIGAGWTGLQMGKTLLDCGYQVKIFETLDDVGGTWHPKIAYFGQTIHSPIYGCEFVDYPYSKYHDRMQRLDYKDIFKYCRNYAADSKLYQHILFNTKVTAIDYDSINDMCTITTVNVENNESKQYKFEYVISTQFNMPDLPTFPGQEKFKGKIYHSNDVKEQVFNEIIETEKKVILIGGSKSATDFAYLFANRNYSINWILKQMYWFYSYDKAFFNFKKGKNAGLTCKISWLLGFLLVNLNFTKLAGYYLWSLLGIIKCPGKKHYNFRKFHVSWLDQHQIDILSHKKQIYSEISQLSSNQAELENGEKIDCDVIICATGCDQLPRDLIISRDNLEIKIEDAEKLYKSTVIPQIPKLIFTGFIQTSTGPLNAYIKAAWFLNYMEKKYTTDQLLKLCDGSKITRINPLFDSSSYFYPTAVIAALDFLSGIATKFDMLNLFLRIHFKLDGSPPKRVRNFINSRIID